MKTTVLTDISPLPTPVVALLDAYRDAHPGAELRLWAEDGDASVCLYPADDVPVEEWSAGTRHRVETGDGLPLALEVRGLEDVHQLDHGFLTHALAQLLHHEREARSAAR